MVPAVCGSSESVLAADEELDGSWNVTLGTRALVDAADCDNGGGECSNSSGTSRSSWMDWYARDEGPAALLLESLSLPPWPLGLAGWEPVMAREAWDCALPGQSERTS